MVEIAWVAHLDSELNGEFIFDGSCVPVRHVIELIKMGITREQLQNNYSKLNNEMLNYAFLLAERSTK